LDLGGIQQECVVCDRERGGGSEQDAVARLVLPQRFMGRVEGYSSGRFVEVLGQALYDAEDEAEGVVGVAAELDRLRRQVRCERQ